MAIHWDCDNEATVNSECSSLSSPFALVSWSLLQGVLIGGLKGLFYAAKCSSGDSNSRGMVI